MQERPDNSRAVARLFRERFAAEPAVIASAPGRVNLIGEHTDYNGGEVLPIAIAARTWVAVRKAQAGAHSLAVSSNAEEVGDWSSDKRRSGKWWDYLHGVANGLSARGMEVPPVIVAVMSDVPSGAGLSSSAALEVATAVALSSLIGAPLSSEDAAAVAHSAETEFVGVACGIMDQFASALGRSGEALHLWCDSARFEHVPMAETVLIFDTAVPRSLRGSAFNERRRECERALELLRRDDPSLAHLAHATREQVAVSKLPEPLHSRATHVVEETRRVEAAVEVLRSTGTIPGALLYESHESLRSLYECSSAELDWFVDRVASVPGISGARLTGAGWGGCAVALGDENALRGAAASIVADYESRFRLTPRAWITRAERGVRVEQHWM